MRSVSKFAARHRRALLISTGVLPAALIVVGLRFDILEPLSWVAGILAAYLGLLVIMPAPAADVRQPVTAEPRALPAGWEHRYLSTLAGELGRVDLPPLPSGGRGRHALADVYLPLALTRPGTGGSPIDVQGLTALPAVVVTGDAGAGKSTLLRHLVSGEVAGKLAGEPGRLPLWISMVDVAARLERRGPGPIDSADWPGLLAPDLRLTVEQTAGLLDDGGLLLVFDMLDEVSDPAMRRTLAEGVADLQQLGGSTATPHHVIVGCRAAAWRDLDASGGFDEVHIEEMDPQRRTVYLRRWLAALWGDHAGASLDRLTRACQDSPAVERLAANPHLALVLARIAAPGPLPAQRVVLFDTYLTETLRQGRLAGYGDAATLRGHLSALAVAIQTAEQNPGFLPVPVARRLLAGRVPAGLNGSIDAGKLLDDLELNTGVIAVDRPYSPGDVGANVRFSPPIFQEFLVACEFADRPGDLAERALDRSWVETLAMAAGVLAPRQDGSLERLFVALLGGPAGALRDDFPARVAAATVCLRELSSVKVPDRCLAPVREAQDRILPSWPAQATGRRVEIAEGFGLIRDPRLTPERRWVSIPAGPFTRGSDLADAWDQERPAAEVTLSAFRIQRWPVTVAEYDQFMSFGRGYDGDSWWAPEGLRWRAGCDPAEPLGWPAQQAHTNRPVTGVCWWEADAYCRWLSTTSAVPDGWTAVLPTEAQWEKAARGPADSRRFPWGDDWAADHANCRPLALGVTPVGVFPAGASPYRVWDLAGNVAERCADGFGAYEAVTGADPVRRTYEHGHVVRGGDCRGWPMDVRVTARSGEPRDARGPVTGFRVALVPVRNEEERP